MNNCRIIHIPTGMFVYQLGTDDAGSYILLNYSTPIEFNDKDVEEFFEIPGLCYYIERTPIAFARAEFEIINK